MDPKTIMVGVAALAITAASGKVLLTNVPTTNLTVEAGADDWTKTVAAIAKVKQPVADIRCERQREGTDRGIVLSWVCNGARVSDKEQSEINKKAGADVTAFTLRPRLDGERVIYDPVDVQGGPMPNLDPIPEEPKPAEALGEKVGP